VSVDLRSIAVAWVSGIPATQQEESVTQLELFMKATQQKHIRSYFLAPFVPTKDKQEALSNAGLNKHVASLVSWLDHKRLWSELPRLSRLARSYATVLSGTTDITVFSAVPLTASEKTALTKKMEARLEGHARVHEKVVPELLGGLIVDVHGTRTDLSIKGKLAAIRAAAKATLMHST
jgi:ATP synthase F1 delta subunit